MKHTVHVFGVMGMAEGYQDMSLEEAAQIYKDEYDPDLSIAEVIEMYHLKTIHHEGIFGVYDIWEFG